ncbi:MAG: hypothetical protein RI923_1372 [Pseudomonadota bacterium]
MLSCFKATQLISLSHERPLVFSEKAALRIHLLMCSACRNFQKNSMTLHTSMQTFKKLP